MPSAVVSVYTSLELDIIISNEFKIIANPKLLHSPGNWVTCLLSGSFIIVDDYNKLVKRSDHII